MATIDDTMRSDFRKWAKDFETEYLREPAGQRHIAGYKAERECVRRYWEETKSAKNAGQDITDFVLYKLLPYSNTTHNREMECRISVAPAITKDIKAWFEGAGWQTPTNWPNVAIAIYDLIYALVEHQDWSSLEKFAGNKLCSKGIQAGIITPTLHCLRPEFRIVNSKTTRTINKLLGPDAINNHLVDYRKCLATINEAIASLDIPVLCDKDVFDAFCHWMCAKRLGNHVETPDEEVDADGEEESQPDVDAEPHDHWEAIYYLVKCGNLLEYKTYVADPSKIAFGKKLGELATLKSVPQTLAGAPDIARVDVIWHSPSQACHLFEVEDGGTMRDALLRLFNAMHFNARFFVVCPAENRPKFDKWVSHAPFQERAERFRFRTYEELSGFYQAVKGFAAKRSSFLEGATEE